MNERLRRLASLFRRKRLERELEEEMRLHLEMKAQELGDANRARREFGNPTLLWEASRDAWSFALLEGLLRDLRHAFRLLRRSPAFTVVAVLTLALGIGANTAIFTLLYNVVLRPLPYPGSDRLMKLYRAEKTDARGERMISFSYPKFEELRRQSQAFESVAAYGLRNLSLTGAGDPERIAAEFVSAAYFPMLGIRAAQGRVFLPEEDRVPGTHPVAMLSDGIWRRRFAADPEVTGKTIRLNETQLTVIGIAPEGFKGESGRAEIWTPMAMHDPVTQGTTLKSWNTHWHQVMGLLRAGVTPAQADQEVKAVMRRVEELQPRGRRGDLGAGAMPLADSKIDVNIRRALLILYAAVGFVLLIACVNLANLLLGRAVARQREVAVRLALGAGRAALVRQFLAETLVVALFGGLAGLVLAHWGMELLAVLRPAADLGRWPSYMRQIDVDALRVSGPVIAFNFLLSIATGIVFGLAPALQASRPDVNQALKGGSGGWKPRLHQLRRVTSRSVLIAGQMALVLVLLTGAGLMLRSFARLLSMRMGFQPDHVLTFRVDLPGLRYTDDAARSFFDRLLNDIRNLPGVEAATLTASLPGEERGTVTNFQIVGRAEERYIGSNEVHPDFFKVFRIPLVAGRLFTESDRAGRPAVALVNETAVWDLFGGENPLGRRISNWGGVEIVGVVGDVRYEDQPQQLPIGGDVYRSVLQQRRLGGYVALRTAGDPASLAVAVRKTVHALDPALPVYEIKTIEQRLAAVRSPARFATLLLAAFAALALALAAVGVYGVFSYTVAARRRELGIRAALGATKRDVVWLVIGDGALLCAAALVVGLPAAFAATRVLGNLLFEVAPTDPATFAAAALVLVSAGLLASYLPARRASRVDPMEALRYE